MLAFPAFNYSELIWFGFIPLFFAIENRGYREVYWLTTLSGMVLVCGGYIWLGYVAEHFMEIPRPLNYLIWLAYGFYSAQLFALIFLVFTWLKKHSRIPPVLIFPMVTVTCWSLFPSLFLFNLANATAELPLTLQGMSFVGTEGMDFIIALANITGYSLLKAVRQKSGFQSLILPLLLLAAWFGYGWQSLAVWDQKVNEWSDKKIGIVQPNRRPSLNSVAPKPGYSYYYPMEMGMSQKMRSQKPDLIVWPEGNLLGFFYDSKIRKALLKATKELNIPIIFHDQMVERQQGQKLFRNSSIWMTEKGHLGGIYHKQKLVLFGEYIPLLNRFNDWAQKNGLPVSIIPGDENKIFLTGGMRITPAICYEIMFSQFVAGKIGDEGKAKVILVQSNDGWYGKGAQAAQHRSSTTLRAVENRVQVIHVVYNGSSSIVLPNGRFAFISPFWKKGQWVVDMPFDPNSGGSFFSAHPYLFLNSVRFLTLILLAWSFWRIRIQKIPVSKKKVLQNLT